MYISPTEIEINKCIGKGAFSNVFEVKYQSKKYAFKKFETNGTLDIENLRELSILQLLKHKPVSVNLTSLFKVVYSDEDDVITMGYLMELYTNDLQHCISTKTLVYDDKLIITKDLMIAVYYLHSNKLIHRDIKPNNIFINSNNNAILGDYSLTKVFSDDYNNGTHTTTIATKTYRAPEVVQKKKYSYKADIWSLGVTLFEMLEDKMLCFDTDSKTINYLTEKIKSYNKNVLQEIVKKSLNKNPDKRLNIKNFLSSKFKLSSNDIKQVSRMCWEPTLNIPISEDISEMAENFEVEKDITKTLSQYIVNKTDCCPHTSTSLAVKFHETDAMNDDDELYEQYRLFKDMNFCLY